MISPECRDEYGAEQRMVSTMLTRYVYVQISIASHNPLHPSPPPSRIPQTHSPSPLLLPHSPPHRMPRAHEHRKHQRQTANINNRPHIRHRHARIIDVHKIIPNPAALPATTPAAKMPRFSNPFCWAPSARTMVSRVKWLALLV